jgi:redox-sensitive bicupin YhaK (pirin superfamily)
MADNEAAMALKEIHEVRRNVPPHWVGDGFPVRSLFSYRDTWMDPFLLLDYVEPYKFEPSQAPRGVGEHPHKGFETVTIVYQGELEHRDSAGNRGRIGPGDVQWMTAASGIVHEEFHSERFTRDGGLFEVAQLWVNLPAAAKKESPRYQEIRRDQIPTLDLGSGTARVIAGDLQGTKGPARTFTEINLWDLELAPGKEVRLSAPAGHATAIVVRKGTITINGSEAVEAVGLVAFDRGGDHIQLRNDEPAAALVLTGEPIGEPVVGQGPFVMNSAEEIRRAFAEYQSGAMGHLD